MQACTVIARNYLAQARVLANTFASHHPQRRLSVLVIDDLDGLINPDEESFEVLTPSDVGLDIRQMASRYDVLELSTAVKPWLLRKLLERDDHVFYLDPDIQVFDALSELVPLAVEHQVLLTPHLTSSLPSDGKRPNEQDILLAGTHNLGFLGLGSGQVTDDLLDWWEERLEHDCLVDPARGYFVDQRWMDFVPGMIPSTYLLHEPNYNVAYWNLHSRELSMAADGSALVDGRPMKFLHFSGYDPTEPNVFSKHQTRITLEDSVLRELSDEYGRLLLEAGYRESHGWPYGFGTSYSGIPLTRTLRRSYAKAVNLGRLSRDPFSPEGETEFFEWLAEPADSGGNRGVTRYMHAVYRDRPDLQRAYPRIEDADAEGLVGWFQFEAPPSLVPPPGAVPARLAGHELQDEAPLGVNLVGYLTSEHGVGEVSRQTLNALQAAGVSVQPIGEIATASRQGHYLHHHELGDAKYGFNLLCINADQTVAFEERAGAQFFAGRYTIGWWWWEVESFPEAYDEAFDVVDEIWVGSRFIAEALSPASPKPVVYMPTPIELPKDVRGNRAQLNIPEDCFMFLFSFDYNSVFERKNPISVVEAFRTAFPEPIVGGPVLVIKSINGDRFPDEASRLASSAANRPDILLHEDYLSAHDKDALMAACDCYVSLHRSEGFGITIAEAMLLGRPVIATAYSGSADLVSPDNAYPIGFDIVSIGPDAAPYPETGEWAEPNIDEAARAMVDVVENPREAERRAGRAQEEVRAHHSASSSGEAMRKRLERINELRYRTRSASSRPSTSYDGIYELLAAGPGHSQRRWWDPRRWLRGIALRLARPQARHQNEINAELASSTSFLLEKILDYVDSRLREQGVAPRECAQLGNDPARANGRGTAVQISNSESSTERNGTQ